MSKTKKIKNIVLTISQSLIEKLMNKNEIIKIENIQNKILTIRNAQVMLDNDLSEFYGVETRVLNQAVKRNIERFPEEFCFQLSKMSLNF